MKLSAYSAAVLVFTLVGIRGKELWPQLTQPSPLIEVQSRVFVRVAVHPRYVQSEPAERTCSGLSLRLKPGPCKKFLFDPGEKRLHAGGIHAIGCCQSLQISLRIE